jgi:hypothetical protein
MAALLPSPSLIPQDRDRSHDDCVYRVRCTASSSLGGYQSMICELHPPSLYVVRMLSNEWGGKIESMYHHDADNVISVETELAQLSRHMCATA